MVGIPRGVARAVGSAVSLAGRAGGSTASRRDDTVQLDLRTQLQTISTAPALPEAWALDTATATAGGARFGGDVTVPVYDPEGQRLEVVTVDVSGKGLAAGTRALLLAGALSALMGVVDPQQLMSALNRHIHRQEWTDGFATAIHVAVDLTTGAFTVTGAGHPPAVHFHAGSGRWRCWSSRARFSACWPTANGLSCTGFCRPVTPCCSSPTG